MITIKATGTQRGGSYHVTRESREVVAIVSIVHPVFGQALLSFLLLVYAACILVPLLLFCDFHDVFPHLRQMIKPRKKSSGRN